MGKLIFTSLPTLLRVTDSKAHPNSDAIGFEKLVGWRVGESEKTEHATVRKKIEMGREYMGDPPSMFLLAFGVRG